MKKNRKRILEAVQAMGVVEVSSWQDEMEGFQKMDTSAQKSQFEKTAATIEQALEILEKYAPEKKGMLASLAGREFVSSQTFNKAMQDKNLYLSVANEIVQLEKIMAENHANILKMNTKIDNITPWVSMDIPMNTTGTKNTDVLIGTIEREVTQEQIYEIELLKRNLWLLGSILILGLAVSIFLYKWYKRRKDLQLIETRYQLELSEREVSELKLQQQEMELKNVQSALDDSRQEVTSFAVFLRSRNELLDKIRGMIKEGYKMDNQTLIPHLKKVNAFISQYQSGDKTNSSLLLNIEEKNKEFLDRLALKHPNLTQGEKYLATLLRVNLSTKEISMITGTIPKTINMNRYRLRKSLNLSTEEDLVEYLQSF